MIGHYHRLKKLVVVTKSHPCCMKMAFDGYCCGGAEFKVVLAMVRPSTFNDVARYAKLV